MSFNTITLVIAASIIQSVQPGAAAQGMGKHLRTVARVGKSGTQRVGRSVTHGIKKGVQRRKNPQQSPVAYDILGP